MGVEVVWTEQAWTRLLEIETFVARDDPSARSPEIVEVLTVFEGHRLLREGELL